jgi:thymidylate synthase
MKNNLDKQYQQLLQDIIDYGVDKQDRTGTGCKSLFGYTIRHNMKDGFPLLTTKKMAFKTMVTELLWFLRGDTNIKFLVNNDCHIWDGDAYKNYCNNCKDEKYLNSLPLISLSKLESFIVDCVLYSQEEFINKIKTDDEFAKKWGELGPIYGKQWRNWKTQWYQLSEQEGYTPKWAGDVETEIDQITNLINDLKTNPDSRRLMVNAWNVSELNEMVLPPCHHSWQMYTRELSREERIENYNSKFENKIEVPFIKVNLGDVIENTIDTALTQANIPARAISLMWNQRSVDTFLGLPFNIASYGLLLMMIADEVGMVPDELIGNLGDTHIYLNHIEQAKEQISRKPMELPTVHVRDGIFCSSVNDAILENYKSHPSIKAPLSN